MKDNRYLCATCSTYSLSGEAQHAIIAADLVIDSEEREPDQRTGKDARWSA
jgi:hypothetical protein